ncbi:HpcH/HpaI aldolase family protein [Billgrantia lactosivorans]|uniref:HpcH/HpaI aldolase family protein n=1 Tax=Billgrantia lactosivorans TaxID=2185141 RepID=UPI000DAE87B7|nr:aldolase/citrate lyase family protein [Halomonas lactosivorans]
MLTPNTLKRRLERGETALGLFASIPTAVTVEMIGQAGFDFVILDTEHTLVNPETLEHMLRAAELAGITALVRVRRPDPDVVVPLLDAGARGIVLADVRGPEALAALSDSLRFQPLGWRSMNGGRPARFGADDLVDYLRRANDALMLVPMIEHREGVENLPAILRVPGVDMVLEGAADLSQSLGLPWQTDAPAVREMLDRIHAECRRAEVPFCAIPRGTARHDDWRERGVHAFVLGDERGIAFRALQAQLATYREEASP